MNPSTRTFRSETAAFFKGCVDHPRLARRIAIVLVSVIAMGLCVMVFNALGVGTDPFACFSYGMAEKLGVSLGTFEAIFHTVTFLVVFSLDRKLFGLGSLANMFLVGYSADFFTWLLGDTVPVHPDPGTQLLWFIPFAALFLVSVAAYIVCGLGTSPYDAAPTLLHERVTHPRWPRLPFRVTRMAWDCGFALLGLAVGGSFGWMTVLCGVGLGPVIDWMARMMKGIID